MKISRAAEMRAMDRTAIEQFGIPEELLMENAGLAVYRVLAEKLGVAGKRFLVFCGSGNNGGDGFVVARQIHSNGGHAQVVVLGDLDRFKGAAKLNLEVVSRLPIELRRLESVDAVKEEVRRCDAIVDAVFGTGLAREVEGIHRATIELINHSKKPVVSVDIPSGVHGDTGQVMGAAVRADCTVTFGLPKRGNMLFPGYELGGELFVSHISFPPSLYAADALKVEINHPVELVPRNRTGHKGDFGEVLFIAGAASYFGAPYFAALSFMKAGGGYARLAAPASITPFIAAKGSEIVFVPQKETRAGSISRENKAALLELAASVDMVVLGPGLSLEEETQQLVRELVREISQPLLVDGDGLTALCQDLSTIKQRRAATVLTPHLGEMSRITGMRVGEIDGDKVEVLQRTARELQAIIVMKGAHSLVGYPDERVFINTSGNSGMATAGSGDVLAGTIAAMFGLGLPMSRAARMGVFVHGLAGDLAAEVRGEDGMVAQDILDGLPLAVKQCREGAGGSLKDRYAGARAVR